MGSTGELETSDLECDTRMGELPELGGKEDQNRAKCGDGEPCWMWRTAVSPRKCPEIQSWPWFCFLWISHAQKNSVHRAVARREYERDRHFDSEEGGYREAKLLLFSQDHRARIVSAKPVCRTGRAARVLPHPPPCHDAGELIPDRSSSRGQSLNRRLPQAATIPESVFSIRFTSEP